MKSDNFEFKLVEDFASADFVFDAYADTLENLFIACATACFTAMTDPRLVEPKLKYDISVSGENLNELLYNYIAELIYLKDTEKIFLSSFEVRISEDRQSLYSVVKGEAIDYNKHVIKTDVKAVTYHALEIKKHDGGFMTRMVLDL